MVILLKAAAASVLACAVCLLLKKNSPEMGLGLSIIVCVAVLMLGTGLIKPVLDFLSQVRSLSGLPSALFYPVVKCLGIGMCAKLIADVCKDSGQAAIGSSVESLGAVCAIYGALPLMESFVDMLGALL